MSDQNNGQQKATNSSDEGPETLGGVHDRASSGDHRSNAAGEAEATKFKRHALDIVGWTAWLTVFTAILAVGGIGTLFFSIRQLHVMKQQLKEMHDGGVDTHNLADAAKQQAKAAEEQAATMGKQLNVFKGELESMNFQQRPNVYVENNPNIFYIAASSRIGWNVNYVDVGERDAEDFQLEAFMSVAGGSFFRTVFSVKDVLPSKTALFSTVVSKETILPTEFDSLLHADNQIRVLVKVSYQENGPDSIRRITRCWGHLGNGAIANLRAGDCADHIENEEQK